MKGVLDRVVTGFVAALVEAWHELRIHKLRVLLSLIGVMVAVAALTTAVAAAGIAQQVLTEQYERDGRPAFIRTYAYQPTADMPPPPDRVREAFLKTADRFEVTYASMVGAVWGASVTRTGTTAETELRVVDPPYAAMHRVVVQRGRWLEPADTANLSPAVVVESSLLDQLGLAGAPLPVTVDLRWGSPVTVTVVGTVPRQRYSEMPAMYMLSDTYQHWFGADRPLTDASFEMWVPIAGSEELAGEFARAMAAELPGYQVDSHREDYLAWGSGDELRQVTLVVSGIAGVILLLGALSLLNVALVTMQQRIREVGIRRSFGATTGRVFFSVMMESIVATAVAGAVGVMVAVALVSNPWVAEYLLDGIDDVPPFPVEAALLGLAVSIGVGALTGVLPALVAARVRIVDAIRF